MPGQVWRSYDERDQQEDQYGGGQRAQGQWGQPPPPPSYQSRYGSYGSYGSAQPMGRPVYEPEKRGGMSRASPRSVFVGIGVLLLALLIIVPMWNAISLLYDRNYVHWAGTKVPIAMIVVCLLVVIMYAVTTHCFFSSGRPQVQTEQTIMIISNIFITLLGLALMFVSFPLSQQASSTYSNLMFRCDYSEQTHRLFEYSQVLHNIRATPACAHQYSVEACEGYESAPPYTTFLKDMENTLHCSGFCWRSPDVYMQGVAPSPAPAAAAVNGSASALQVAAGSVVAPVPKPKRIPSALQIATGGLVAPVPKPKRRRHHRTHRHHGAALSFVATEMRSHRQGIGTNLSRQAVAMTARSTLAVYPPTLFSNANYQASCEGMAARDIENFAGDIAKTTFCQGIYLVIVAICTGFMKLIGFCIRKESESGYEDKRPQSGRFVP